MHLYLESWVVVSISKNVTVDREIAKLVFQIQTLPGITLKYIYRREKEDTTRVGLGGKRWYIFLGDLTSNK